MISISDRALLARVNRRLAKQDEPSLVRVCREDSRCFNDFGRYYATNYSNHLVASHIDLEEWARELKAI